MIAGSVFLTDLECTKFVFGRGCAPYPTGVAYSSPPDPRADLRGPTSKGKGERNGKEGRRGEGSGRRKAGREGEKERGECPHLANSWIRPCALSFKELPVVYTPDVHVAYASQLINQVKRNHAEWASELRYLGVFVVSSRPFKCSKERKGKEEYLYSTFYILFRPISHSAQAWITQFYLQIHRACLSFLYLKRSFYAAVNGLFEKLLNLAIEEVVLLLELIKARYSSVLLYGLECIHSGKADLRSIDFPLNRFCMKMFKSGNIDLVKDFQRYFCIDFSSSVGLLTKGKISLSHGH